MTLRDFLASVGIGTVVYVLVQLGLIAGHWAFGPIKRNRQS